MFYLHELQYLHGLRRFLIAEDYPDIATRVQQVLQGTVELPTDLWTIVYTIFEHLVPPAFEHELDRNFEPRTDQIAMLKRAHIAEHGFLGTFRPPL